MRILLIDDDPTIRAIATASLGSAGWTVETAATGLDGIAKAEASVPDAILLDMRMPELDGPATLEQLRASPVAGDVPVIMLTAAVGWGEEAEAVRRLPVAAVIGKPFDILGLAAEVASVLGWDR